VAKNSFQSLCLGCSVSGFVGLHFKREYPDFWEL